MVRTLIFAVTALLLAIVAPGVRATEPATRSFIALAYHNVEDSDPDQQFVGITTAHLVEQLTWLQTNGYQPVTIDDLLAARDGAKALPEKAVLLTFDDGYESFYTRVLPILKAFRYPAVLALVGAWMEGGPDASVRYSADHAAPVPLGEESVQFGTDTVKRSLFLTWDQVREIAASGLVEIASHSYDAHRGVLANPQGNSEPDETTRQYDPASGTYESDASERQRLEADSAKMAAKIASETGKRPRVMVWPYGETNGLTLSIAAANGMPITLTLADAMATLGGLGQCPGT